MTKELAENGDIRSQDVKIKRGQFINKTNELIQEFYFAHPRLNVGSSKSTIAPFMAGLCGN